VGNAGLAKITGAVNGNNGTLTIQGNIQQFGTNTVEVVAEDNNGFFGTNTFTLALFFVDHPPTVDVIPRQVVPAAAFWDHFLSRFTMSTFSLRSLL
jgi:hypothetical protein